MCLRTLSTLFSLILLFGHSPSARAQEIRMAILAKPGSAQFTAAAKFKELVEADSLNQWSVALDPIGVGRNETEAIEQIRLGTVHMGIFAANAFEQLNPIVRVLSYPFLFSRESEADAVLDGPLGAAILRDLETIACKGLGFTEIGFRHLTNSVRPIQTIEDLKDLKIRVAASPIQTALWLSLGANPVPKPWPIYSELEQGRIEAQENPLRLIETYNFFEVQKYLTLTRHSYTAAINIASLKWWTSLPQNDQVFLVTAMRKAMQFQRLDQRARDAATLMVLKGKGMLIAEEPDLGPFRARTVRLKEMPLYREPRIQALLTKIQETIPLLPPPAVMAAKKESLPLAAPDFPAVQATQTGTGEPDPVPTVDRQLEREASPTTAEPTSRHEDAAEFPLPQTGNPLATQPAAPANAPSPPSVNTVQTTEAISPAPLPETIEPPSPADASDEQPPAIPQTGQPAAGHKTTP